MTYDQRPTARAEDVLKARFERIEARKRLLQELGDYTSGIKSDLNIQARLQRELELCLESEETGVELPVEPLAA